MPPLLNQVRAALSFLCLVGGAGLIVAGALGPWAQVTLFKNIDLSLSGLFFAEANLCLAVAALVLLGARRWPLACLVGAVLVLHWTGTGRREVPHRVKHQVIGAQLALFPVNRLLDQFHIPNVEVGNWSVPNPDLLGPGLARTESGGRWLLLGALLGLPGDPFVVWIYLQTARAQCRACGARWRLSRGARFCPECGTPAVPPGRQCPACGTRPRPGDRHCVACGTVLPIVDEVAS